MADKRLIDEVKLSVFPYYLAVAMGNKVLGNLAVSPFMIDIAVEDESYKRSLFLIDLKNALLTLVGSRTDSITIRSLTAIVPTLSGLLDSSSKSLGKDVHPLQFSQTGHDQDEEVSIS